MTQLQRTSTSPLQPIDLAKQSTRGSQCLTGNSDCGNQGDAKPPVNSRSEVEPSIPASTSASVESLEEFEYGGPRTPASFFLHPGSGDIGTIQLSRLAGFDQDSHSSHDDLPSISEDSEVSPTPSQFSTLSESSLLADEGLAPQTSEDTTEDTTEGHDWNEVQLLRSTLANVVKQRDWARARCDAQSWIIRDLALVNLLIGETPVEKSSKKDKEGRWVEGWKLGSCAVLSKAEKAWSVQVSPSAALAEVEKLLSSPEKLEPDDFINAKLLLSAILRSLDVDDKDEPLRICEEVLTFCWQRTLPRLARKAQFHRGLWFTYNAKYAEASWAFSLALGLEDHAEQIELYKKIADQKLREQSIETNP